MAEAKKNGAGKVLSIVLDVIFYAYLAFAASCLIFVLTNQSAAKGSATIFGSKNYIVLSASMEKGEYTPTLEYEHNDIGQIKTNSLVTVEATPDDAEKAYAWYGNLATGDVVTFTHTSVPGATITHRIIQIRHNETAKTYTFTMQGDNWSTPSGPATQVIQTRYDDPYLSPEHIEGKVTGVNYELGVFLSSITSPVGKTLIIIVPSVCVVIYEACKLVFAFRKDKAAKRAEQDKAKDAEIERLKHQINEMQKGGEQQ